jgi:uncharacterized protein YkwD
MHLDGYGHRRAAILLLLFVLVTCMAAEEGVLVLVVTDTGQHPFANVRIGTAGEGGSPQSTDQSGKARLRLAPNTKPAAWVTLLITGTPHDIDLVFISPYDGRVRVPPYDNEQENYDPVVVVKRGDRAMLESGSGMLAIHATMTHTVAAQRRRPTRPTSQNFHNPRRWVFGGARLQTVAMRVESGGRDPAPPDEEELQQAAMAVAAHHFGLPVAEIEAAVAGWGGDPLMWKTILLTATIEAGGTDPFPFVRAGNDDVYFGIGSWSLRGCGLQPLLLRFQQRDRKRFAEIVGDDTEWLSKTISAPCEASSTAALQRMLEPPGVLRPEWRERLRRLGNEPEFQHVEVEQMIFGMQQAQSLASQLGLTSEQAVAFCYDAAVQAGAAAIRRQKQNFSADVAGFQQQIGREPDQQEQLLMLANRVIQWRKQAPFPQSAPAFIARATLLSQGQGTVLGQHYSLDDFDIGLRDTQTGIEVPVHNDPAILRQLEDARLPGELSAAKPAAPFSPGQMGTGASPLHPANNPGEGPPPKSSPAPISTGQQQQQCDSLAGQQLLDLINQERAQRGLPPLQADARLTQTACQHTAEIVKHQTLSHQFAGEPALPQRYADAALRFDVAGENTAMAGTVSSVHRVLMNSPEHRDAILNPDFNSVGIGVLRSGDSLYVTEDFAQVQKNYSNDEAAGVVQHALASYAAKHGVPAPARRPQPQLEQIACHMAQNDALNTAAARGLPGASNVVAWSTANVEKLPSAATNAVLRPLPSGYSLGACFAPSASHPGGVYWVVMVVY